MTEFYADCNLDDYLVWPTEDDHHGAVYSAGAGLIIREPIWTTTRHSLGSSVNRVISGFVLPSSGDAYPATITAGSAVIAGYLVTGTANLTGLTFTNTTSYVYLGLVGDGTNVTKPVLYIETARIAAVTKWLLFLGTVTAAGGTISTANDQRTQGRCVYGSVVAGAIAEYGSADWTVSSGTVTFINNFLKVPTVIVSPYVSGGGDIYTAMVTAKSVSAFTAASYAYNSGSWAAYNSFEFVVFG